MRRSLGLLVLLAVVGVWLAGCESGGFKPAYAVFRFTDANGQPIQVIGQRALTSHEPGVVLARNAATLGDGRAVVQELVVVDPLELAASEYRVDTTPEGFVSITGGSLENYVVTPPKLP